MDIKLQPEGEAVKPPPINPLAQLKDLFGGRTPMLLPQLVELVASLDWPETVFVHPADFYVLTTPFLPIAVPPVHKDNTGPYFYLSRSKVRPVAGETGGTVDISNWESPEDKRVQLAKFER